MVFYLVRDLFCGNVTTVLPDGWRNSSENYIPHVTECGQHVDFSWFPALFLLIFSPVVLYDLHRSINPPVASLSPIIFRILICVILVIDLTFSFIYNCYFFFRDKDPTVLQYLVGDVMQYVGLCVALVLLIACRNRGIVTSGVLSLYWLLMVLCGLPEFRYVLDSDNENESLNTFRITSYIIFYMLCCLELILSCFADTPSTKFHKPQECPELHASFFNQLTFHWFTTLAIKGYRRPLEKKDLWELNDRDSGSRLNEEFEKTFIPEMNKFDETAAKVGTKNMTADKYPSVLKPIFYTYKMSFIAGAFYKLVHDLLQFAAPELLRQLLRFIQDTNQPKWIGIAIACMMFLVALLQSMILHQYFHMMFRLGMNIRSVLTSAVYKKALNLSNNARKNRTVGEIVNIMSVDIQRIQDMTSFVMLLWSAPLQVLLAIFFLFKLLGWAVFGGFVLLLLLIPFNTFISARMKNCQLQQMKFKDERLKMMSEILNGIKVLKLYAWEKSMKKMVTHIRDNEISVLKKLAYLNAATTLSWSCAPFLVAVLSFGIYVLIDPENNVLTPEVTFVAIALFNILRFPLAIFSMIYQQATQSMASNNRLRDFFASEEMDIRAVENKSNPDIAISIQNGVFSWESVEEMEPALKDINISVKRGSLVAVVGRVGYGKSSLLHAILGEMNKTSGNVNVCGSVAYVPQLAWIQNQSLRDNVLFNRPFEYDFYNQVIDGCALGPDIEILPAGDATEIGEKGINLSGGQKQRVSLARATYSKADIVLLDDPLSAVDAHVGKHIFENVISHNGILKNCTRVLVTHGLHNLKYCDYVIVFKEGRISESGTYKELMAQQGEFSELIEEFLVEQAKNRGRSVSFGESEAEVNEILKEIAPERRHRIKSQMSIDIPQNIPSQDKPSPGRSPAPENNVSSAVLVKEEEKMALLANDQPKQPKGKLVEKENVETGRVAMSVYFTYIMAIGIHYTLLFVVAYIVSSCLGVGSNLWLARWSDDAAIIQAANGSSETHQRLLIYAGLGMGQAFTVCLASIIMALGMVQASRTLHNGMLTNILHSPMSFFDTTPIGRILNRFGKDVNTVDLELPEHISDFVWCVLEVLGLLFIICTTVKAITLPIVGIIITNFLILDMDALDSTVPNSIRSMITTIFGVFSTLFVILYATPMVGIAIGFIAIFYILIMDIEALDFRVSSSLVTMVSAVVQAVMILFVPVYITPSVILTIIPILIFYYFLLDIDGVDNMIPRSFMSFIRTVVASAEILLLIIWATPSFLVVFAFLFVGYCFVLRFYVNTSRQLKRLDSASRSPIFSHFQESIQGASSIRAYKVVDKFVLESQKRVDDNLATYYPNIVANRWLAVRLELVGNLIVLCAALFAVLFRDTPGLTAGLVGLSVSYALNITQTLNWAVRMTSELETNIVAVERIKEYTETPTEGQQEKVVQVHVDWPNSGDILIKDYSLRYREGLDLVLKEVTVHINPKEKIGIVGRTGAGKSSLTLALFRIVEADGGFIEVDGMNIAKLSLEDLRSRLTIVPQDPVLFSGTLRMNLDPFDKFNDEAIWGALHNAHLDAFVSSLPDKLAHKITEGGENMSVGQRQLICLARALLRKTKILILDEAAAAVDVETDALLQKTIREQFKECTVLTIAHRMNTVMDSDRMLVLDKGTVAEFDTPKNLLANQKGIFYSMAVDAGIV